MDFLVLNGSTLNFTKSISTINYSSTLKDFLVILRTIFQTEETHSENLYKDGHHAIFSPNILARE